MKKRVFIRAAGAFFVFLALAIEGMMIGRVQGSAPASVIAIGNVAAVLKEPGNAEEDSRAEQAITVTDPRPGQAIRREPVVCMTPDSERAYLRARILVSGLSEQRTEELLSGLEQPEGWTFNPGDGYYYYKKYVSPGQDIPVFQEIHIPKHWKHADKFQVNVTVEVAEMSCLTPRVDAECRIMGWIF